MNQVPVPSKKWMQTTVANANRGIITFDTPSVDKLVNLMKTVMRRNGEPHWAKQLEQFYELAGEQNDGQKIIQ